MAQQQLGLAFVAPATISASEEATNHPATNLLLTTKWRRTARSTTTGNWTITWDFGTTTALDGLFLNHANFATVTVDGSANGSSWTALLAGGATVGIDDVVQPRRKVWIPGSDLSQAFNFRYGRMICSALLGGESAFELGALAFPKPVSNMVRNFGLPRVTPREPVAELPYPGGGSEVNVEGPDLAAFDLPFGPSPKNARAQQLALRAVGMGQPFFYYENRGDKTHAYILKRTAAVPLEETFSSVALGPWQLIEAS